MKKQLILLIVSLVVLISLAGTLFFALRGGDAAPEALSSSEAASIPLLSETEKDLVSITVKNGKGTYTLENVQGQWSASSLEGLPVDAGRINELAEQARSLSATRELTSSGNPEDYGLAEPRGTITLKSPVGERTINLGNEAPSGLGTYLQTQGNLYLASTGTLSSFSRGLGELLVLEVLSPLESEETIGQITLTHGEDPPIRLTYVPEQQVEAPSQAPESIPEGTSGDESHTQEPSVETIPASYTMTAPLTLSLRESLVSTWVDSVFGLTAQVVEAIHPTEQALSAFGLDNPAHILELSTSGGKTVRLSATTPVDGSSFVLRDGVPLVYKISADSLGWLTVTPQVLAGTLFLDTELDAIQTIAIEGEGQSYLFSNENGKFSGNGTSISGEAFEKLAEKALYLSMIPLTGEATLRFSPALTMTVSYRDASRSPDILELVSNGEGLLYMVFNDQTSYTTEEWAARSVLDACKEALTPPETAEASSQAPSGN